MHYIHALRSRLPVVRKPVAVGLPRPHLWFSLVLGLVLCVVLAVPLSRASLIAVGQPSPVTIEAPRTITFISDSQTRAEQAKAESNVPIQYDEVPGLTSRQRQEMVSTLSSISRIRDNEALSRDEKIQNLTEIAALPITPTLIVQLLDFSDDEWQGVSNNARRLYDNIIISNQDFITEEVVRTLRTPETLTQPELASLSTTQRQTVLYFVESFLKPNRTIDQVATDQLRAQARANTQPVQVTVARGENVVRRGDIVSEADYEILTQLNLVRGAGGLNTALQMVLLGALTAWLFATYINYFQENLLQNRRALIVIIAMLGITLLAGRLLTPSWETAPYVFPLATLSILITILFNGQLAVVGALALAPLIGLLHEQGIMLALPLALGAVAGSFTALRACRMLDFAWVALAVAVATMIGACAFWLGAVDTPSSFVEIIGFSLVNGGLSGILAVGSYHFWGRLANVVTPLELMELSRPDQPLLRRLMREAPGTYHHSIVVGNLAEVAAENIGADPLLTRVGAYYHDVGKMLRPYFFTDNQHDRSNVHDVLDAKTSAKIIIDHVREGAKLAREHGLPQSVVDFIPQHHGTNLMTFFYQRALQEDEDIDIEEFRYPGPKPQTREAAILMLADGVEAAVRAKAQAGKLRSARPVENGEARSGQTIAEIVKQIVEERMDAGQLDEAPLTLRDIAMIEESFILTLQGIYHPRVEYGRTRNKEVVEIVSTQGGANAGV